MTAYFLLLFSSWWLACWWIFSITTPTNCSKTSTIDNMSPSIAHLKILAARRDQLQTRLRYAVEAARTWPSGRRANDIAKVERQIRQINLDLSCAC